MWSGKTDFFTGTAGCGLSGAEGSLPTPERVRKTSWIKAGSESGVTELLETWAETIWAVNASTSGCCELSFIILPFGPQDLRHIGEGGPVSQRIFRQKETLQS